MRNAGETRVLILVVMEDALAPILSLETWVKNEDVLILVVMEDALAHLWHFCLADAAGGLNPCCNGRCTRTHWRKNLISLV